MPCNRRFLIIAAAALLVSLGASAFAIDRDKAKYESGTVAGLQEKSEGTFTTSPDTGIVFDAGGKGSVIIPFASIESLLYGHKLMRRVNLGFMRMRFVTRERYLTVRYKDSAQKEQTAMFELGDGIVDAALKAVETRSGKAIEYLDPTTCKQHRPADECDN